MRISICDDMRDQQQHHHHHQQHHRHHLDQQDHHQQQQPRHFQNCDALENSESQSRRGHSSSVHHHHHHHHHHHYIHSLPHHHHHHHHHRHHHHHHDHRQHDRLQCWSSTMPTTALTVLVMLVLASNIPTIQSVEDKDAILVAPMQGPAEKEGDNLPDSNSLVAFNNNNFDLEVAGSPPQAKQKQQQSQQYLIDSNKGLNNIDNSNNNNNYAPQLGKFMFIDLKNNGTDAQSWPQLGINSQKDMPWMSNHGVPPPVQEHQKKIDNWANPPPPPPFPDPVHDLTGEAGQDPKGGREFHFWDQSLNQKTTQQRQARVPEPRVNPQVRKEVEWSYSVNYYSLKASSDARFLIRYAPPMVPGAPWPLPQMYQSTEDVHPISPEALDVQVTMDTKKYPINSRQSQQREGVDFYDDHNREACQVLDFNVDRMRTLAFGGRWDRRRSSLVPDEWSKDPNLDLGEKQRTKLDIRISAPCEKYPHLHMNESYMLSVEKGAITLISPEVWGAIRGLETLSQLVYQLEHDPFKYWINVTYIRDFPRFKHRGILLDTARHYLDMTTLLENLESMAQNKFNVFHWHIVDDQSFPFKSYSYPNLTKMGAYDYDTHIYTHEDIQRVMEYARLRGIRVIPEFDTPGHTFSWGFGQNHLLTPCHDFAGEFNGLYGPINPILRRNYNFLRNLFKEVMSLFKDKYIHLGGDEVPFDCWMSNPQIKKFMKKNLISDIRQILSFYARQLLSLVSSNAKELNRKTGSIVWQEMFDNDVELPLDTIIQVWSGDSYDLERITKMGYGVLFSTCWYLDYIQYGQDWDKYYMCDHIANLRLKNESLFYGGEVCLWAEYTDDSDIMTRLWPRAAAAAERLWSHKDVNNVFKAASRLETQRCRMMEKGLQVGVLSGPNHCTKFRQKRQRSSGARDSTERSLNLPPSEKVGDDSYPQGGNLEKRKLNRYRSPPEVRPGQDFESRNFLVDRSGRVMRTEQGRHSRSGLAPVSGSVGLYLVVCLLLFFLFVFLKKKWVKLPVPTYFLTRNYRAFIICLILLTAAFIWLQHVRFSSSKALPPADRSG